jgi:hypothetical protein
MSSVAPFRVTAWLSFIVFSAQGIRRVFGSADQDMGDFELDLVLDLNGHLVGRPKIT